MVTDKIDPMEKLLADYSFLPMAIQDCETMIAELSSRTDSLEKHYVQQSLHEHSASPAHESYDIDTAKMEASQPGNGWHQMCLPRMVQPQPVQMPPPGIPHGVPARDVPVPVYGPGSPPSVTPNHFGRNSRAAELVSIPQEDVERKLWHTKTTAPENLHPFDGRADHYATCVGHVKSVLFFLNLDGSGSFSLPKKIKNLCRLPGCVPFP